jgi:hypothetical protein
MRILCVCAPLDPIKGHMNDGSNYDGRTKFLAVLDFLDCMGRRPDYTRDYVCLWA